MAWDRVVLQESGEIEPGANSYVDEEIFEAYCETMGQALDYYTEDELQTAVLKAARYINSLPFTGTSDAGQYAIMKFPQDGIVPEVVIEAQSWLSVQLMLNPELNLYNNTSSSAKIKQETVGPISTTYFAPSETGELTTGVRFDYIDNLLAGLLAEDTMWVGIV